CVVLSFDDIQVYNTFFEKHVEPLLNDCKFELNHLCADSKKVMHSLKFFYVISCLDTILVYNTYFDRHHDHLKHVLHVLGNESLVLDLNKYMACTYDLGILVSVLSVQDKQVQPHRGVRDERRDYVY